MSKPNDPGGDGDAVLPRIVAVRKLLARVNGARMCFGEPVKANGRTIIPVAKTFSAGGGGFGTGEGVPGAQGSHADVGPSLSSELVPSRAGAVGHGAGAGTGAGSGGGGGGTLWATPVGFIEVTDDGARFEAIPDPERSTRMLSAAVKALPALMAAWAGLRALRAGAGPDELARVLRAARGKSVRPRPPTMLPSPLRSRKR